MSGLSEIILNQTANMKLAFRARTNATYVIMAEDNFNDVITPQEMGKEYQYRVIPEFSSFPILSIFMAATRLATVIRKRKDPYCSCKKDGGEKKTFFIND